MGDGHLKAAERAARRAGAIIRDSLGRLAPGDVDEKQASDFVTRVDRESEAHVVAVLRDAFPSHSFLTEETLRDASGGYRWIIDPLDGTTNFIHGYPMFSVSIALEHDGSLIAGLVYDPLRDELFTAERGAGAFMNGERLRVSSPPSVRTALIATGFPFKRKDMLGRYLDLFSRVFLQVSGIRRAGSAALDLAYLAAGRCDGFFEIGLSPWDIAAGAVLIEEAGGVITDFSGGGGYMDTGNIVGGTALVHPMLLGHTRDVFSGVIES